MASSLVNRKLRPMNMSKLMSHFPPIFVPAKGGESTISPIEGRNYDRDVIEYMTSPKRAREIRDMFLNWATGGGTAPYNNFRVIDAASSVGGATRFFLEPSAQFPGGKISKVIAYELDDARRQMLANNLSDYGFSTSRYEIRGEFLGVPMDLVEDNIGPIIVFDPPWTTKDIPGRVSKKDDYILSDIMFGQLTMEQWVQRCWNCSYILIRGPPKYMMSDVKGFSKAGPIDLANSGYLYVYWPNKDGILPDTTISTTIEPSQPTPKLSPSIVGFQSLASNLPKLSLDASNLQQLSTNPSQASQAQPFKLAKAETPKPSSGYAPVAAPTHRRPSTNAAQSSGQLFLKIHGKDINKDTVEIDYVEGAITVKHWEDLLTALLRGIFFQILPDKQVVDQLIGPSTIDIWKRTFTAQNVNPNPAENYEPIEKFGDKVMGSSFALYMLHKFPGIDQAQINDLDSIYVSKVEQAKLSKQLGLGYYVRRMKELAPKKGLWEDVLEALFGGIVLASEKAFGNQTVGYGIAYNLMVYLYEPLQIKLSHAVKSIVNFVKEALEKIGLQYFETDITPQGSPTITKQIIIVYREQNDQQKRPDWVKNNLTSGLNLVQKGIDHWNSLVKNGWGLRELNYNNGDYILAQMSGAPAEMTKDVINSSLYGTAFDSLNKLGLTSESSQLIGDMMNLEKDYLSDIKDRLLNQLNMDGYTRPTFKRLQKDLINVKVQTLFGVRSDGTKEPLVSAAGHTDQDAERRAVLGYLGLEYF